jgi:hypothetical protein
MPKYSKIKPSDEPFIQVQCVCGLYTFEKPRLDYIFGAVFSIIPSEHIYPKENNSGTICIFKRVDERNTYIIGVADNLQKRIKKLKDDDLILLYYYPCKNAKNMRNILQADLKHFKVGDVSYYGNLKKIIYIIEDAIVAVDNVREDKIIRYDPKISIKIIKYCRSCQRMPIRHKINKGSNSNDSSNSSNRINSNNNHTHDEDLCKYKGISSY